MAEIRPLRPVLLFPMIALALLVSGCGQQVTPGVNVNYQPPFAPVIFTIGSRGISVQAKGSIVTEWGTFSLGADINDTLQPKDNALYIIIRGKQNGVVKDVVYKIETNQQTVTITTNGTTTIEVSTNRVFIDASKGNIKSIEVTGAKSTPPTANAQATQTPVPPPPTPVPTPTTDPMRSLTLASAANLIIHFYDEKGDFANQQLLKRIVSMTLPQPENSQVVSCVDYENAQLDYPEQVYGTWTRQFTLQYSASAWTVLSMGSEDCTVVNGKTPLPQTNIGTPPALSQVASSIMNYYNNDWHGFYVMDSVQSMAYRQQVGNYVGACVYYTYHAPNHPEEPEMNFHAEFGFAFKNGQWTIGAWDQSGCGPNYNS